MNRIDVLAMWLLTLATGWCVYSIFRLRRHHRDLPIFHWYFLTILLVSCLRLTTAIMASRTVYFWVYWYSQPVTGVTLLIAAVDVLSRHLGPFRPVFTVPKGTVYVFAAALFAFLLALSLALGFNAAPTYVLTNCFTAIQQATVGVSFGVLACCAICCAMLQIKWTQREALAWVGIIAEVLIDAALLRAIGGLGSLNQWHATLAARLLCLVIWLYAFCDRRPEVVELTDAERSEVRGILKRVGSLKLREVDDEGNHSDGIVTGETDNSSR